MTKVFIVNAFGNNKNEGNPAGVILDANILTDNEMISISKRLGFSESAFVQNSKIADYKVRFFSQSQEVDLCGHATIATFHSLIKNNLIDFGNLEMKVITQETKSGILPVTCYKNGLVVMEQRNPEFIYVENDLERIASLLGLTNADILTQFPIELVSTGTPKLIIPVKSLDVLFSIKPNFDEMIKYCKEKGAKGFYPFTFETKDNKNDFHSRQFNPIVGIYEDPITGVAAGALGAYAVKYNLLKKNIFTIEQGYIMNKPGIINVKIKDKVLVGGNAIIVEEKEIFA